MRVLDQDEYSNVWVGMWWALQTVTTVGYGDVTPEPRVRAESWLFFATLKGIAFLTIIAAITLMFIARAQFERNAEQGADEDEAEQRIDARLDRLSAASRR